MVCILQGGTIFCIFFEVFYLKHIKRSLVSTEVSDYVVNAINITTSLSVLCQPLEKSLSLLPQTQKPHCLQQQVHEEGYYFRLQEHLFCMFRNVSIRILFDNESQQSYISHQLEVKLGLKPELSSEKLRILTRLKTAFSRRKIVRLSMSHYRVGTSFVHQC